MWLTLKLLGGVVVAIALLAVFAWLKPVTASALLWPSIETYLLDDFVGVTSDGKIEPNLFHIRSTGATTAPVMDAASAFIDTLTDEQKSRTLFPIDDTEWRRWANIHISTRQGVGFLELSDKQANAARAFIASGLSQRGYDTAIDIMRLEGHLADLMQDHNQYGEQRYWLTIMGTPSLTEPWGWQLDGHHLVINFFVLADQVVMTPLFMGSEPVRADSGPYAGTEVLQEELTSALAFVNMLDPQQLAQAVINPVKTGNNNRGELFQDNAVIPHEGLLLSGLNEDQRTLALELLAWHVNKLRTPHARIKMDEIMQHWETTRFAWVGATDHDAVFYYRFHSPVVLIEYDHQSPIALGGPNVPSRRHVHTTMRTPNGNDYGKDLLRQHLATHRH